MLYIVELVGFRTDEILVIDACMNLCNLSMTEVASCVDHMPAPLVTDIELDVANELKTELERRNIMVEIVPSEGYNVDERRKMAKSAQKQMKLQRINRQQEDDRQQESIPNVQQTNNSNMSRGPQRPNIGNVQEYYNTPGMQSMQSMQSMHGMQDMQNMSGMNNPNMDVQGMNMIPNGEQGIPIQGDMQHNIAKNPQPPVERVQPERFESSDFIHSGFSGFQTEEYKGPMPSDEEVERLTQGMMQGNASNGYMQGNEQNDYQAMGGQNPSAMSDGSGRLSKRENISLEQVGLGETKASGSYEGSCPRCGSTFITVKKGSGLFGTSKVRHVCDACRYKF